MQSDKHCENLSGKNYLMQLLQSLQIFKTDAFKSDKAPKINYVEEEEEKDISRFILQFWGGRDKESKILK